MARKKKERVMAFDVLSPDTLHPHNERVCRNFVCYEGKVSECLVNEIRRPELKNDEKTLREFKVLTGYQTEARDGLGNLGLDMVSLLPVTLESSVKTTTPYIYRTIYYGEGRPDETFCTRKDAISYIQKKIKTKNVVMHYNGMTERCELTSGYLEDLFAMLEPDTIEFDITAIGRGGIEGDSVLVTIYKNCMKV